jgi:glutamate transport system permease protein
MNVLTDNWSLYGENFLGTIRLTVYSSVLALLVGAIMAGFRVAPVRALRALGTVWVNVLRNTPLTLLFFAMLLGLPRFGVALSFEVFAVLALGCYTSAFICEAVRSGMNTVPLGQAEAARSIGMTFTQTLRLVVLPQATRTVIPPIGSLLIALAKNSAIAGGFSVFELFSVQKTLGEKGYNIFAIFLWVALAYLIITGAISVLFRFLESRLAVAR